MDFNDSLPPFPYLTSPHPPGDEISPIEGLYSEYVFPCPLPPPETPENGFGVRFF